MTTFSDKIKEDSKKRRIFPQPITAQEMFDKSKQSESMFDSIELRIAYDKFRHSTDENRQTAGNFYRFLLEQKKP